MSIHQIQYFPLGTMFIFGQKTLQKSFYFLSLSVKLGNPYYRSSGSVSVIHFILSMPLKAKGNTHGVLLFSLSFGVGHLLETLLLFLFSVVVTNVVVVSAVVGIGVVISCINWVLLGGHACPQYPQLPIPSKLSSTFVKHQYLSSGSVSVIHSNLIVSSKKKGNTHGAFTSGLSSVVKH